MLRKILVFILGGLIGAGIGLASLFFLVPRLPLPRSAPLWQKLGITKPVVMGFLPYWLVSKAAPNYNSSLNTLTYYGLDIGNDGHIVQKVSAHENEIGYTTLNSAPLQTRLAEAKKNHLDLSLLVYDSDEASISALLNSPVEHAMNLANDVVPLMQQSGFTNLNLDIESFQTASDAARQNFTQFVKTVQSKLKEQPGFTLSIDLSPSEVLKPDLYDPYQLGQLVDHVILMTYDYSYRSSYVTGAIAPVGGAPAVRSLDIASSLQNTYRQIPANKIVLGIPLYGYQWETLSEVPYQPIIPSSGATATQRRVMTELNCTTCVKVTDPISQEPYLILPGDIAGIWQQTFYEDQASFTNKVSLAKSEHLAGVALWALGYEDDQMLQALPAYKKSLTWLK